MNKIKWINLARGFAIIMVVLGHAISGASLLNTYHVWSFWNILYRFITSFHMPLFFFISGYLYNRHNPCNNLAGYKTNILNKIADLVIPYIIFEFLYVVIGILMKDEKYSVSNFLKSIYEPMSHFWFIYVLFFIYLITPILLYFIRNELLLSVILVLISIFINDIYKYSYAFPLNNILYYMIFFCVGKYFAKNNFNISLNVKQSIVIFFGYMVSFFLEIKFMLFDYLIYKIYIAFLALIFIISMTKRIKYGKFLEIVGENTMSIYLVHSIFVSASRRVLLNFNFENYIVVFISSLVGVLIPLFIGMFAKKDIICGFCLYPRKTYIRVKTKIKDVAKKRTD